MLSLVFWLPIMLSSVNNRFGCWARKSLPFSSVLKLFSTRKTFSLPTAILNKDETSQALRCVDFINNSPDPYHAVKTVASKLNEAGFVPLKENDDWTNSQNTLNKGGKYYFTRQDTSIVAFTVGGRYGLSKDSAMKIMGAHTDSPVLKIKPNSKRPIASNMIQLNVECYGGGLWHTWFDRDLSLAGKVMVRNNDNKIEGRLINIAQPILRIPNLCIHLQTQKEREAFVFNKETHLQPVFCSDVANQTKSHTSNWQSNQETVLLQLLAEELGVNTSQIIDVDLTLYDTQTACLSGLQGEFIVGARCDNLASCFALTEAIVQHSTPSILSEDSDVSVMVLFDHEEVGSESNVGAGSPLISDTVRRIITSLHTTATSTSSTGYSLEEHIKSILRRSLILSVDMAHAVHPNYAAKHDKSHSPLLNKGIVIKSNANQKYATSLTTRTIVRELGQKSEVPLQDFVVRNDCPCGSTIGPM